MAASIWSWMMPVISVLLLLALQTVPDWLAKGITEFHEGNYAAARANLEKAPDSPHRRTFLALVRAATGGCNQVTKDLADELATNRDADLRRLAGLALVQCHLAQNHLDQALPAIAQLKALYPSDADVLYQSARVHMKAWNGSVQQLFQANPASFRVNQISAEIFEVQGKYAEAVSEYRKAIAKNGAALNLHYRLGRALLMESHAPEVLDQARKEFEVELKLNPTDAVAHYQIGQILLAQQKRDDAFARFEHAAALSPDFPEPLLAIAKLRLEAHKNDEAIQLLEKVLRLQPANEGAHYSLMMAYRHAGRTQDALRQKAELEKLQRPPEGEFTDFLKKLGEKPPQP